VNCLEIFFYHGVIIYIEMLNHKQKFKIRYFAFCRWPGYSGKLREWTGMSVYYLWNTAKDLTQKFSICSKIYIYSKVSEQVNCFTYLDYYIIKKSEKRH
jgi:hypothetical protein